MLYLLLFLFPRTSNALLRLTRFQLSEQFAHDRARCAVNLYHPLRTKKTAGFRGISQQVRHIDVPMKRAT